MVYLSGEHRTKDIGEISSKTFMKAIFENYVGRNSDGDTSKIGDTYLKRTMLSNSSGYFSSEAVASELIEFHIEADLNSQPIHI